MHTLAEVIGVVSESVEPAEVQRFSGLIGDILFDMVFKQFLALPRFLDFRHEYQLIYYNILNSLFFPARPSPLLLCLISREKGFWGLEYVLKLSYIN